MFKWSVCGSVHQVWWTPVTCVLPVPTVPSASQPEKTRSIRYFWTRAVPFFTLLLATLCACGTWDGITSAQHTNNYYIIYTLSATFYMSGPSVMVQLETTLINTNLAKLVYWGPYCYFSNIQISLAQYYLVCFILWWHYWNKFIHFVVLPCLFLFILLYVSNIILS